MEKIKLNYKKLFNCYYLCNRCNKKYIVGKIGKYQTKNNATHCCSYQIGKVNYKFPREKATTKRVYQCPKCGKVYEEWDNESHALFRSRDCCDIFPHYECAICRKQYSNKKDAINCCKVEKLSSEKFHL